MIGRTNAFSGGGVGCADTDAMCRVIAPAGSTVTFSRGAVTKTSTGHQNAVDSSQYDYYFVVPSSAFSSSPWTATATLNGKTDSLTVVINAADEYDVLLSYDTFIIRNGVVQAGYTLNSVTGSSVTAPVITSENGYLNVKLKSSSGVYVEIDRTGYTELYLDSGIANGANFNWAYFGFSSSTSWSNDYWDTTNSVYYHYAQWYPHGTLPFDLTQTTRNYFKYYTSGNSTGFDLQIYNLYMR